MKALIGKVVLLIVFCVSLGGLAAAQYGSVRGTCKDAEGTPIAGADIVWKNQGDGRTYKLKTDKKGSFFSLGVEPGDYVVTLSKDGHVLDEQKRVHVGLDEFVYDVDLKKAQEQSVKETAKKTGVTTEQVKQQQVEASKAQQFNANVKVVNEKLSAAAALMKAQPPDYKQAIAMYQEATTMMPDQDIVWFRLGSAYLDSARAQTDPAEKARQNTEAYNNIQKAIELRKSAGQTAAQPVAANAKGAQPPQDNSRLASYYDNLGAAAARLGKTDEAGNDYQQAAELDPPNASRYYFNMGVTLHNLAKDAEGKKKAADAFSKAIAADPSRADAYFLKGSDLFALIEEKEGKMVAPDGTAEAFQKYLELQPTGPHADEAKQMLAALNSSVESSYGAKKGSKKK